MNISRPLPTIRHLGCLTRTFSSWASAIRKASSPQQALHLYTQMQRRRIPFDSYSVLFTLTLCSPLRNLPLIRHFHAHLHKLGLTRHVYAATALLHAYVVSSFQDACGLFDEMPERNTVTFNMMITGYSKLGDVRNARLVFDCIAVKDVASWSAMISAYMCCGNWDRGLTLFREMVVDECLIPDQVTFGSILPRCSNMGSVGLLVGKSIHGFMEKNTWDLSVEIQTALVDMYTKCGLMKSAFLIFDRMKDKNVVTWSTMICGLAQHGYGEKALLVFEKMKQQGIKPNEITFTGVFSACTHTGLVEEGLKCFEDMVGEYKLEPRIQHYGCMVDLLGKAGRLDEAYRVIESMKLEPNIVIWGSFLAACKEHKKFKLAEKVIQKVLEMVNPEIDGGVYTLISDLYAMSGKWDEVQRLREVMTEQKVKKARGSSFIRSQAICNCRVTN